MKSGKCNIGVCSWSFQKTIDEIGALMATLHVDHVHLALAPALGPTGKAYLDAVKRQNWIITSTMLHFDYEDYTTLDTIKATGGIAPDGKWAMASEAFVKACALTAELGVPYISMHVGFLDPAVPAYAKKFHDRVRFLGDAAQAVGVTLLMETGQESAEDLRHFLITLDHPGVMLNFDPANMILYDKDEPIQALRMLAPWIRHVHAKDAIRTKRKGTWGSEVPWGDGEVNAPAFLNALRDLDFEGTLAIEREAGTQRINDIAQAVRRLATD